MSASRAIPGLVLIVLIALVIVASPILPFIDFYAHVARYHILAEFLRDPAPAIAANYQPNWTLLPNLGLDVIGTALMLVFEPLVVAKIIVVVVVATLFTGILYLSRVLHGSILPLSILLAGIVAFHHILAWGFMNFCLGLGLMVWSLGFWIANDHRPTRQLLVSVPIGVGLLFVHGVIFALWGLMLGMIELTRLWEERRLFTRDLLPRMGRLIVLAVLPFLLFLQMPTSGAEQGVTNTFDNLASHAAQGNFWPRIQAEILARFDSMLRVAESRWYQADYATNALIWGGLALGLATGYLRLHRRLWGATGLAVILVPLMPPNLFGVTNIDERIPVLLLILLAAGLRIEVGSEMRQRILVAAAIALTVRTCLTGAGWAVDGQFYREYLARVDTLDLEGPAALVMLGDAADRNTSHTRCEPLLPLLLLRAGAPVQTFSHATQQPLRLAGSLLEAAYPRLETLQALEGETDHLAALMARGFATIVTCGNDLPETDLPTVTATPNWAIFTTSVESSRATVETVTQTLETQP